MASLLPPAVDSHHRRFFFHASGLFGCYIGAGQPDVHMTLLSQGGRTLVLPPLADAFGFAPRYPRIAPRSLHPLLDDGRFLGGSWGGLPFIIFYMHTRVVIPTY